MGIDHGRFDILVSQKGLDFPEVDAVHEEMGGETMPSSELCRGTHLTKGA